MSRAKPLVLRHAVREFVRAFGLLSTDRSPCGKAMHVSEAHALMELRACDERGDAPTLRGLREALQIDKSNVSRLCRRLQTQGLVDCQPCDEDGRAKRLTLTPKGRALADEIDAASRKRFDALVAALPKASGEAIIESLEALTAAIREVSVVEESP